MISFMVPTFTAICRVEPLEEAGQHRLGVLWGAGRVGATFLHTLPEPMCISLPLCKRYE